MEYNSVAILGAGAVGCYMLWGLTTKKNIDLCVVADGERKERFERDGFIINGVRYNPVIKTPEEARGVDLLLVATKYNGLKNAIDDISTIVTGNTTVMSLMNGVDSEEIIAEAVGSDRLVYSVMKVASERKGNSCRFDPETTIGVIYGELEVPDQEVQEWSPRIMALNELFSDTGLHYRASGVILSEIWSKFRLNVQNNLVQAMLGLGVGVYRDSEHANFLRMKLRDEVEEIAKAKGIDLSLADKSSLRGSKVADRARYSTLQDLDAGRHTEIDMFSGAIIKMGKELGIPTPYNEFTYHMIKTLEEKNDGKFQYE